MGKTVRTIVRTLGARKVMFTGIKFHLVRALITRDLRIYFSNPSGYVFITLFIFLSAAAAFWQERFFLSNLANLDQLTSVFPQLLLLFIPALTMSVWSEERKQGTDELLLTLPASDVEIVLGKYLAVLGVYTASLGLSLSHVAVLSWLGDPDVGLMLGNYLGFWLLGAALIGVGMLGSLLTINMAVAFVLGAVFCGSVIFVEVAASLFSSALAEVVSPLGVLGHFQDFSDGVVSLSGLVYFTSLAGLFLYANVLIIGRRHWLRNAAGISMGLHQTVRAIAVLTLVVCANAVVARASARLDVTEERLHTLTDQTRSLIGELSDERPVLIRAFVSPTVPEQYVQTRATLLALLREIDVLAGPGVEVLVEDTEPYTDAAVDAQETFGITSRPVPDLSGARTGFTDVFLGVAFTCGAEEQVIPFFDRGLPAEYEIMRSIRVVAQTARNTVGVVNTAIRLFGGLDFQTMRSTPSWSIVEELRKQYEVVEITPTGPITEEVDGLVVVLPSSLTQEQMNHVRAYIEQGHPTMLLVDPLPVVNIGLAPSEEPNASMNPFMAQNQPPPPPKGDVQELLAGLGVRWDSSEVAWDIYNPHPDLAHLPPEVIFVGEGSDSDAPFNQEHPASAQLQELVLLYPGHLARAADSDYTFAPLLRSGPLSGTFSYSQMVQRSFFGVQLNPSLPHQPRGTEYALAAHVTGTAEVTVEAAGDPADAPTDDVVEEDATEELATTEDPAPETPEDAVPAETTAPTEVTPPIDEPVATDAPAGTEDPAPEAPEDAVPAEPAAPAEVTPPIDEPVTTDAPVDTEDPAPEAPEDAAPAAEPAEPDDPEEGTQSPSTTSVDVIVVADLDFISEQFFDIRRAGPENLNFDNISFFLNCIDALVGDESFIELRRRRVQHRTLSRVEQQTQSFIEQRATEEAQAEREAEQALNDAQQRLNERVQEVRDRPDLDDRTKQIMARNLEEVENRRFEVLAANIEAEKEATIQRSRRNMESQIRQIQSSIRTLAVVLPPIPVFALGVAIFVRRQRREREGAAAARRMRA